MKKRQGVKKLLAGFMAAAIGIAVFQFGGEEVWASGTSSDKPIEVRVNGGKLLLDSPAFIHQGRVMVPFRGISAAMGAEVRWNQADRTAIVSNGKHTTSYTVGHTRAMKDGKVVTLMLRLFSGRDEFTSRSVSRLKGLEARLPGITRQKKL